MLFTVILLSTLSQFPKSQCVTTNGTGACGYDCKTTNGKAACASTPWGRCTTTDGKIFCGDPSPFAQRRGITTPVQCVTTNGTGACGYDCKTSNGRAACASSPWGRCTTTDGKVFCGDPSPLAQQFGVDVPVECVTTNGTGACGYDCQTTNGKAACASTPWGRCTTTDGRIFCADPGFAAFRSGEFPPQMDCVITNGIGACGYACVKSNGKAACSPVPWGECTTTNGDIFCTAPQ